MSNKSANMYVDDNADEEEEEIQEEGEEDDNDKEVDVNNDLSDDETNEHENDDGNDKDEFNSNEEDEEDNNNTVEVDSRSSNEKSVPSTKKSVKIKRTFKEELPKPKPSVHELFIRLPGCGKDKQRVSVRPFPWPRSFEERYKKRLAEVRRENILRSLGDDEQAKQEFLEQEKMKKRKRRMRKIKAQYNNESNDIDENEDEYDDDDDDEMRSEITDEEDEDASINSTNNNNNNNESSCNKKKEIDCPTYWLPYLLSNDTAYLERVLSVMYGWIVPPSSSSSSASKQEELEQQQQQELAQTSPLTVSREDQDEEEIFHNATLAHVSSESNDMEHSLKDDELKTATFHELAQSPDQGNNYTDKIDVSYDNKQLLQPNVQESNTTTLNENNNTTEENIQSKDNNKVEHEHDSNNNNSNNNLIGTVNYTSETRKKSKHHHKSQLTRIPRFTDCTRLLYIVKENESNEWHLLDMHPSIYMKYASCVQQRRRQAAMEATQVETTMKTSEHSRMKHTDNNRNENEDEEYEEEEEEDEEEEEEESESKLNNKRNNNDSQDVNSSDEESNDSSKSLDVENSISSICSFQFDLQSVIVIDTMMLAALTSPMGLHYCLLQPCQLSLERVQKWIDVDQEVGYMLLSSIYVVLRGIRANDEPRLRYALPALQLDFNQFFRDEFFLFCSKSSDALQTGGELDYNSSASRAVVNTTAKTSTRATLSTRDSRSSSFSSSLLHVGNEVTAIDIVGKAGLSLFWADSNVPSRQLHNVTPHSVMKLRWTMEALLQANVVPSKPIELQYLNCAENVQLALWLMMAMPEHILLQWHMEWPSQEHAALARQEKRDARLRQRQLGESVSDNDEPDLDESDYYPHDDEEEEHEFESEEDEEEEEDDDEEEENDENIENVENEEEQEEEEEEEEEQQLGTNHNEVNRIKNNNNSNSNSNSNNYSVRKKVLLNKLNNLTDGEVERNVLVANKRMERRESKERALVQFRYVNWQLLLMPSDLLVHTVLEIRRRLARESNGNAPSQFTLHEALEPFLCYSHMESNQRRSDPLVTNQFVLQQCGAEFVTDTVHSSKPASRIAPIRHQKLYQSDMVLLLLALTITLPPRERLTLNRPATNYYNNNNYYHNYNYNSTRNSNSTANNYNNKSDHFPAVNVTINTTEDTTNNNSNNMFYKNSDLLTGSNISSTGDLKEMSSSVNIRRKSKEHKRNFVMQGAHLTVFCELLQAKLNKHVMPLHKTRSGTLRILFEALPRFKEPVMMRELCEQAPRYELFGENEPCPLHSMLAAWQLQGKDNIPPQCIDAYVNTFWHELYYRFIQHQYSEQAMQVIRNHFSIIIEKVNERFYQYRSNLSLLGGQLHRHSTVHYGTNRSIRKNSSNSYTTPSNLGKSISTTTHHGSLSLNKPFRPSLSVITESNTLLPHSSHLMPRIMTPTGTGANVNLIDVHSSSSSQLYSSHTAESNVHTIHLHDKSMLTNSTPSPPQQQHQQYHYSCYNHNYHGESKLEENEEWQYYVYGDSGVSLLHPSRFGAEFKAEWLRVSALFEALPMTERSYLIPETLYLLLFEVEEVDTVAVRYLLEKGVITVRSSPFIENAIPVLEYALQRQDFEVAQLLVGLGASLEDCVMHGSMTVRTFAEQQLLPSQMKQLEQTSLLNQQVLRADTEYMYGILRPVADTSV